MSKCKGRARQQGKIQQRFRPEIAADRPAQMWAAEFLLADVRPGCIKRRVARPQYGSEGRETIAGVPPALRLLLQDGPTETDALTLAIGDWIRRRSERIHECTF